MRVPLDLVLHSLGRETRAPPPALHALVAFAYARAQSAEVGSVAGAPGPAACVGRVRVAQVVAAGLAEPDFVWAVAGGAQERVCGEGFGRGLRGGHAVEAGGGGSWGRACRAVGFGGVFEGGWVLGGVEGEGDGEAGFAEAAVAS